MIARLKAAAAAVGAAVLAIVTAWFLGRRSGAATLKSEILQKDAQNANRIEKRADAARARQSGDPLAELRKAGRLRD